MRALILIFLSTFLLWSLNTSLGEYIFIDTWDVSLSFSWWALPSPVNGVCWTSNSLPTTNSPTTNLCSLWIETIVTTSSWSFTWSCNWTNGWTNISCSSPRQYTITFDSNWWTISIPLNKKVIYNEDIGSLSTTTRNDYNFKWWYDAKTWWTEFTTNTKVLKDTTIYAIWESKPTWGWGSNIWGWWGGGWWTPVINIDDCPKWDYSWSYYDKACWEPQKEESKKQEPIWESIKDKIKQHITQEDNIIKNETKPISIIPKKEIKQCEANNLVSARQCKFSKIDIDFLDINQTFAKDYILALWRSWIVQWYYNSNLFKPNNTISRAEYLKVILRAFCFDYEDEDTSNLPFTDVNKKNWEAKVIAKAYKLWVINSQNKKFRPHDAISRAESLKIIFDISWVIPKEAYITKFEDVNESWWEVKYIQKANDMCIVDWYKVDWKLLFKPYDNMTRAEVAKVIANTLNIK